MAYLTEDQYDRRRENAAKRNADNEAILIEAGWSESDAELISKVCSLRHEMHSNMDAIVKNGSQGSEALRNLNELNIVLENRGLPVIEDLICEEDMDDMDGLIYYYGDAPADHESEEFEEWYDKEYQRIYDELSECNESVEHYLKSIDEKYGTHFAPIGAQRLY